MPDWAHMILETFYRPQHSCGKVMFLHLSVILFTGGHPAEIPPTRQTPLDQADTPRPLDQADTPTPSSRHPHPQQQTPPPPVADSTPPDGHCSGWYVSYWNAFLFFKKWEDISAFCGATDTPVLDFWWCLPFVSKSKWIPCLQASSPMCNGILRITFVAIRADLLAAKSFQSTSIGGLESGIYRAAAS